VASKFKFSLGWALALVFFAAADRAVGVGSGDKWPISGLCRASLHQMAINARVVGNSEFTIDRDLDAYKFRLGEPLQAALLAREDGAPQTWIDLGAGNARALRQFLIEGEGTGAHGKWKGVAVGVELPKDADYSADLSKITEKGGADSFRYLKGFFSQIPVQELPRADLITDFFGVLSYTESLSADLQRALSLLKPGGRLIMTMIDPSFELRVKGKDVGFAEFVAQISGVKLQPSTNANGAVSYTILRTAEPLRVPKLKMTKFRATQPPVREFELERDPNLN